MKPSVQTPFPSRLYICMFAATPINQCYLTLAALKAPALCRVYKNYDPRATVIRKVAEDVFAVQGRDPLIDVAVELERVARSDDYFKSRSLYPNVDFYSGACNFWPCVAMGAMLTRKAGLVAAATLASTAIKSRCLDSSVDLYSGTCSMQDWLCANVNLHSGACGTELF